VGPKALKQRPVLGAPIAALVVAAFAAPVLAARERVVLVGLGPGLSGVGGDVDDGAAAAAAVAAGGELAAAVNGVAVVVAEYAAAMAVAGPEPGPVSEATNALAASDSLPWPLAAWGAPCTLGSCG